MKYRLDRDALLDALRQWNTFLKRKVHLIACGGTALTLLGVKESTKDVDFMVPVESEHRYLTKTLKSLAINRKPVQAGGGRAILLFTIYSLVIVSIPQNYSNLP